MTSRDQSSVRDHFNERAPTYANLFDTKTKSGASFGFQKRSEVVTEIVSERTGAMMDCATGTGDITAAVMQACDFSRVHVNDFSPDMMRRTKSRIEQADGVTASCSDIFSIRDEIGDEKFDVILCLGLIAHTGRVEELLSLLKSCVQRDGVIILQSSLLDHVGLNVVKWSTSARHERRFGYRQSFYRLSELLSAATQANLRTVSITRYSVGLPFGDRLFPRFNHFIEQQGQRLASWCGAEAIIVLEREI
ncbi:class I SAM-dependent methyltransferase [Allorhodopirellula solitaria]|uniref:Ubiquinone/menaquinone biosynthesis methyltransferase n=1 Tax=Allorhodopirellula solitaria TaxID=2527987 RepID=A0A5C5YDQ0_9BACT|nr:class I SAM-dependent methyltransferase [Allorhodopirellula solitaria]TWT72933.1 ubiquinone/menaquinone biosynthesis methyltransferase [Allorhodopirellula solitaria]